MESRQIPSKIDFRVLLSFQYLVIWALLIKLVSKLQEHSGALGDATESHSILLDDVSSLSKYWHALGAPDWGDGLIL